MILISPAAPGAIQRRCTHIAQSKGLEPKWKAVGKKTQKGPKDTEGVELKSAKGAKDTEDVELAKSKAIVLPIAATPAKEKRRRKD